MDKFVNATKILDSIDAALKAVPPRANGKSVREIPYEFCYARRTQKYDSREIQHREFRPVVHAHWIEHFEDFGESFFVECSACHSSKNADESKFCPDCGAVMDEEVK